MPLPFTLRYVQKREEGKRSCASRALSFFLTLATHDNNVSEVRLPLQLALMI
jgi:hypothetical protein